MADKTVKSITGKTLNRENAIRIREKYHEKNVDCVRINDKWISIHFNNVAFDEALQQFNFSSRLHPVLVSSSADYKQNAVGFSSEIYGEPFNLFDKETSNVFYALSEKVYKELDLKKCKNSGFLFPKGISPFNKVLKYNRESHDFHYAVSLENARKAGIPEEKIESFGLQSSTFRKTGGMDFTFGVEAETCGGVISKTLANGKLNIDYIYDGSVYSNDGNKYGGGEIVTGVLIGDAGVNHLKTVLNLAQEHCQVNPSCGMHIHIGGFKPTDEEVVNAYMLGSYIQEDLFAYLPKKRKMQLDYAGNITGNVNVYCKPLPGIQLYDAKKATNKKDYGAALHENYMQVFEMISAIFRSILVPCCTAS